MIALALLVTVMAVALPGYSKYRDRVDYANAIVGINTLVHRIEQFYADHSRFPANLAEIGMSNFTDPWGGAFKYLRIYGAGPGITGLVRKDKNLHPLNTDYDLYSMGKNGVTTTQIITSRGKDDIIRASNGKFVGIAADY